MSSFGRGLILTLVLTVIAAAGGTWIGARYIYDQRHQPSLHEFVHEELKLSAEQRKKIEAELGKICEDILDVLDKHLIPSAQSGESKVFYHKMCVIKSLLRTIEYLC